MKYTYDEMAIDKHNLDEECLVIPAFFDYFATRESESRDLVETLRDQMELAKVNWDDAKARAELTIRGLSMDEINHIFELNLSGSLTVGSADALRRIHPDTQSAKDAYYAKQDEYRVASKDLGVFVVARRSAEAKMGRLDTLAKLHGQGYFTRVEGKAYRGHTLEALKKRVGETIRKDREKAKRAALDKGIEPNGVARVK